MQNQIICLKPLNLDASLSKVNLILQTTTKSLIGCKKKSKRKFNHMHRTDKDQRWIHELVPNNPANNFSVPYSYAQAQEKCTS